MSCNLGYQSGWAVSTGENLPRPGQPQFSAADVGLAASRAIRRTTARTPRVRSRLSILAFQLIVEVSTSHGKPRSSVLDRSDSLSDRFAIAPEAYVTEPNPNMDPADLRTELFWAVA